MKENARLVWINGHVVTGGWRYHLPSLAEILGLLKVQAPRTWLRIGLHAGGAKDCFVGKLHRFVFEPTNDSIAQTHRITPTLAIILSGLQQIPPSARGRLHFVEPHQRAFRNLNSYSPSPSDMTCRPYAHIGLTFGSPAKPGRDKGSVIRLNDGDGVTPRHRIGIENEFGSQQGGLNRVGTAHHESQEGAH